MKHMFSRFLDMLQDRNAGVIGGTAAFVVAVLLVIFGVLRTLFIVLMTLAGYLIGVRLFSDKERLKNFLDKIIPPGRFR